MGSCHQDDSFHDLAWSALVNAIHTHFGQQTGPLFLTEPTRNLWDTFLQSLDPAVRQQHTCRACESFVKNFGALVTITDGGEVKSAIWPAEAAMKADKCLSPYVKAVAKLREAVQWGTVQTSFHSPLVKLGLPVTGIWTHLWVANGRPHTHRAETAEQRMAREVGQFAMLQRVFDEYPLALCQRAMALMQAGSLYRGSEHAAPLRELITLHQHRERFSGAKQRKNLLWLAATSGSQAMSHLRGTAVGTLLDGLAEGKSNDEVKRAWTLLLDPARYQRATEAPKEGTLVQAEKMFRDLGLEPSLARRYASLEEIPVNGLIWSSTSAAYLRAQAKRAQAGGVFSHLKGRGAENTTAPLSTSSSVITMTWEKFKRTVLNSARTLHAQVPADSSHFSALVTAVDAKAPPLLKWDDETRRNPFSWYYRGGADAEMKARVERAGGLYENVDIRATLMWHNRNDLDLHVWAPNGAHIYFADKRPYNAAGGYLDVDMNVRGETSTPVENTRWGRGTAPAGNYKVLVRNYAFHEISRSGTPFSLELQVGEHTFRYDGCTKAGAVSEFSDVHVASFSVRRVQGHLVFDVFSDGEMKKAVTPASSTSSRPSDWGLAPLTWAEVTGISTSPNLWFEKRPEAGDHTFFFLRGAADSNKGRGRGFFSEMLRAELRPVRSVMEAYAATADIEEAIGTPAAGLGFIADRAWNLRLRVTTDAGSQDYLIDRKD